MYIYHDVPGLLASAGKWCGGLHLVAAIPVWRPQAVQSLWNRQIAVAVADHRPPWMEWHVDQSDFLVLKVGLSSRKHRLFIYGQSSWWLSWVPHRLQSLVQQLLVHKQFPSNAKSWVVHEAWKCWQEYVSQRNCMDMIMAKNWHYLENGSTRTKIWFALRFWEAISEVYGDIRPMYMGQGAAEDWLTASGTPFGTDKCSYASWIHRYILRCLTSRITTDAVKVFPLSFVSLVIQNLNDLSGDLWSWGF